MFEPVVSPGQVETVAALAAEIWREHYEGILSPDQIEYMVEQFQSASAVDRQIMEEGYRYWLIKADGQEAGYYGACPGGRRPFPQQAVYPQGLPRQDGWLPLP